MSDNLLRGRRFTIPKGTILLQKIRDSEAGGRYKCVKQEKFFHGFIPKEETEKLLKEIGDFLVRQTVKSEAKNNGRDQFEISIRLSKSTYAKKEDCHETGGTTDERQIDQDSYQKLDKKKKDLYVVENHGVCHFPIKYSRRTRLFYANRFGFNHSSGLIEYHQRMEISVSSQNPEAVPKKAVPKQKWQFNHEQIDREGSLGSGAFGEVFRGTLRLGLMTTEKVAVKKITEIVTTEENKKLFEEAEMMQGLEHKHVVKFFGVASNEDPVMIVMEFCPNGSVLDALKNPVPIHKKIGYIHGAALGLQYIHGRGIVHRDVAARNTLIGKGDVAKISDFGLSITAGGKRFKVSGQLPIKSLAPQALRFTNFNTSTDMWAFGIYIYEVFNINQDLYAFVKDGDIREIKKFVLNGKRLGVGQNVHYPTLFWQLTKRCWAASTDKRIKVGELVEIIEAEDRKQNGRKWFRKCRKLWPNVEFEKPIEDGWIIDDIDEEKKEAEDYIKQIAEDKKKKREARKKNHEAKSGDTTTKTNEK